MVTGNMAWLAPFPFGARRIAWLWLNSCPWARISEGEHLPWAVVETQFNAAELVLPHIIDMTREELRSAGLLQLSVIAGWVLTIVAQVDQFEFFPAEYKVPDNVAKAVNREGSSNFEIVTAVLEHFARIMSIPSLTDDDPLDCVGLGMERVIRPVPLPDLSSLRPPERLRPTTTWTIPAKKKNSRPVPKTLDEYREQETSIHPEAENPLAPQIDCSSANAPTIPDQAVPAWNILDGSSAEALQVQRLVEGAPAASAATGVTGVAVLAPTAGSSLQDEREVPEPESGGRDAAVTAGNGQEADPQVAASQTEEARLAVGIQAHPHRPGPVASSQAEMDRLAANREMAMQLFSTEEILAFFIGRGAVGWLDSS